MLDYYQQQAKSMQYIQYRPFFKGYRKWARRHVSRQTLVFSSKKGEKKKKKVCAVFFLPQIRPYLHLILHCLILANSFFFFFLISLNTKTYGVYTAQLY